jgi:hypothetical protein
MLLSYVWINIIVFFLKNVLYLGLKIEAVCSSETSIYSHTALLHRTATSAYSPELESQIHEAYI